MPFTISHAVLAPPISKLTGYRLPISALAIGSMTPDLYRLFTATTYDISHHWSGIIIPNLLIGLGFCLFWYALWRPAVFRWIGMVKPLGLTTLKSGIGFILSVIVAIVPGNYNLLMASSRISCIISTILCLLALFACILGYKKGTVLKH